MKPMPNKRDENRICKSATNTLLVLIKGLLGGIISTPLPSLHTFPAPSLIPEGALLSYYSLAIPEGEGHGQSTSESNLTTLGIDRAFTSRSQPPMILVKDHFI
jgi:hypothetical protein